MTNRVSPTAQGQSILPNRLFAKLNPIWRDPQISHTMEITPRNAEKKVGEESKVVCCCFTAKYLVKNNVLGPKKKKKLASAIVSPIK